MTLKAALAFTIKYGMCARCGRWLAAAENVERGIAQALHPVLQGWGMNRFDVGLGAGFGAIVVVGIVALSSMHPAPPTPASVGTRRPCWSRSPASTTAATAAPTARPAPTAAPTPAPTPFAGLVSTGGSKLIRRHRC